MSQQESDEFKVAGELRSHRDGFGVLRSLLSNSECESLQKRLPNEASEPFEWVKGSAVSSRHFHDLAIDVRLVEPVAEALGTRDILLWGASLVRREPGQIHPWHSDIESCGPEAHTVSVWIGLGNTTPETSLTVAPGSHRHGKSIQELAARDGLDRDAVDDSVVTAWNREFDGETAAATSRVAMADGDALIFDGRLWHTSHNQELDLPRLAVLLQYTAASAPVRMPDFRQLGWPFQFLDQPRIPCLRVSGDASENARLPNRIVAPPMLFGAEQGRRLRSSTQVLDLPLVAADHLGLRSFPVFRGYTHHLSDFSCHVSALGRGDRPHPPHQHPEEEILLVLEGEATLSLPTETEPDRELSLGTGEFAYYPAGCWHTLTGTSETPVQYLMLKWFGEFTRETPPLPHAIHHVFDSKAISLGNADGFKPSLLFEGATGILTKLHCHLSVLEPGAGYDPHPDDYDVVLIVLEGEIETLGQRVSPVGVVYYAAGEPHGIFNPGSVPARYVVFELHGSQGARLRLHDHSPDEPSFVPAMMAPVPAGSDGRSAAESSEQVAKLEKAIRRLEKRMDQRWRKLEERLPRPKHRLSLRERYFSSERWKLRLKRWSKFQSRAEASQHRQVGEESSPEDPGA